VREVSAILGMLDRDGADVPRAIEINLGVLVEILGVDDGTSPERDVEGILDPGPRL